MTCGFHAIPKVGSKKKKKKVPLHKKSCAEAKNRSGTKTHVSQLPTHNNHDYATSNFLYSSLELQAFYYFSHKVATESYDLTVVNYYSCLFNSRAGAKSHWETQLRANKIPATLSQPFVQVMPQILFKPGALCRSTRWQCKDKRQGHFGVT